MILININSIITDVVLVERVFYLKKEIIRKIRVLNINIDPEEMKRVLRRETIERLNKCESALDFSCYRTEIPGYIAIPVKFSEDKQTRMEQEEYLKKMGYKPVSKELIAEYLPFYKDKEVYAIDLLKLLKIHR